MISDFLLALFSLVSYFVVCIYIQFSHVISMMNEIIFPKLVFIVCRYLPHHLYHYKHKNITQLEKTRSKSDFCKNI